MDTVSRALYAAAGAVGLTMMLLHAAGWLGDWIRRKKKQARAKKPRKPRR